MTTRVGNRADVLRCLTTDVSVYIGEWRELLIKDAVSGVLLISTKAKVEIVCPWWMPRRFFTWLIGRCFRMIEQR